MGRACRGIGIVREMAALLFQVKDIPSAEVFEAIHVCQTRIRLAPRGAGYGPYICRALNRAGDKRGMALSEKEFALKGE